MRPMAVSRSPSEPIDPTELSCHHRKSTSPPPMTMREATLPSLPGWGSQAIGERGAVAGGAGGRGGVSAADSAGDKRAELAEIELADGREDAAVDGRESEK